MIRRAALTALLLVLAGGAGAETIQKTYQCDRGVRVPVVYVNDPQGENVVVLWAEGGLYTLIQERAASGVRYGFPNDGSHYIWWEHQGSAMLLWRDGTTGTEAPVYESCTPV